MPDMALYKIKLLNEFEGRFDVWGFSDFEKRLKQLRSTSSYQDAKSIINLAHREGKWPNTVKQYLVTNFKAHGNVSSEFSDTFRQVIASMSDAEKKSLGI
jgi:hypothetical protein